MTQRKDKSLVVAAIDFGTTYSGYAYSFKQEFTRDPLNIYMNTKWKDHSSEVQTDKAPTSILFEKNGDFHSFGFDAEAMYADLVEENKHDGWRFFKRFKMALYREVESLEERFCQMSLSKNTVYKKLSRDITIKDEQGRSMSAMAVFSNAIKFLKDHFIRQLKDRIDGIQDDDVHWILTVPAIWCDSAKQFMRESALKAGIFDDQLTLALEPEAAAIYCKEISVKRQKKGQQKTLGTFDTGEEFILIDLGGGTVDITCNKVLDDGKLKELYRPSGGPWGGILVDNAYFEFLKNVFGMEFWDNFIKTNPSEKIEIERNFEVKKRNTEHDKIILRIGSYIIEEFNVQRNQNVKDMLAKSKHGDSVEVYKEKLKIQNRVLKDMFKKPVDAITEHIQRLLAQRQLSKVATLLLVGGFSASEVVKDKIKSAFPDKLFINPPDADLAVLKGAVLFGHSPFSICQRSSPRTYGISVSKPWDSRYLKSFYHKVDGREVCTDLFQVMVRIGQPLIIGETVVEHICRPASAHDTTATVEIYESTEEAPMYTRSLGEQHQSPSRCLGELNVNIPDTEKGMERRIKIQMHFGFTELKVSATEIGTNNKADISFDFLKH